jgi:hypothetical protein
LTSKMMIIMSSHLKDEFGFVSSYLVKYGLTVNFSNVSEKSPTGRTTTAEKKLVLVIFWSKKSLEIVLASARSSHHAEGHVDPKVLALL